MTNTPESPGGGTAPTRGSTHGSVPSAVHLMRRIEQLEPLDALGSALAVVSRGVTWEPLASILRGTAIGHAVHPMLTDIPIGCWTSATVLDLAAGKQGRPAARLLTALGVVAAIPTAASGLAEWALTSRPQSRVGSLHAALNVVALGGYALSWRLRVQGRDRQGAAAALASMVVATGAGYLGGHLVTARKTGSRDASYEDDGVGPRLVRPSAP